MCCRFYFLSVGFICVCVTDTMYPWLAWNSSSYLRLLVISLPLPLSCCDYRGCFCTPCCIQSFSNLLCQLWKTSHVNCYLGCIMSGLQVFKLSLLSRWLLTGEGGIVTASYWDSFSLGFPLWSCCSIVEWLILCWFIFQWIYYSVDHQACRKHLMVKTYCLRLVNVIAEKSL
jgi:hypothetical protein